MILRITNCNAIMEDKNFIWTSELNKRLLQLRFDNEWLFKKKKQPWGEFHKILLENGFPEEMTVKHVRKKWSYMYDTFKIAKRTKNKEWKYYKAFEKYYGKTKVLDKYESWNDEWRLKLITCITEAKALNVDFHNMWRTVERAMRCQVMPNNCCVLDMKGLWHHIKITFNRKHRIKVKKGQETSDWPLYVPMLEYYQKHDANHLVKLETESSMQYFSRQRKASHNYLNKHKDSDRKDEEDEFQWSKDITETFIQIRLQNDWLFRERKWAWNDLLAMMTDEYGFPKTLTGRDICRKWASTFSEYQKAKATNNKSWVYYNLFELYLGEGSLSLNPIVGWQEEWISNLISARVDLEHLFKFTYKDQSEAWREVEKRLRSTGLPLDHSLLDLPEIWTHLLKTFKWKQKFANKGILTEQWPYYEAMAHYEEIRFIPIKKQKQEDPDPDHFDAGNDDYEDDMKLFDLKQKLGLKPKFEMIAGTQCRSCSSEDGCVNIFEQSDDEGLDLAEKLKIVGGIEVESSDSLPSQICINCLREIENAYKFRRKCQEVDKHYRDASRLPSTIKIEATADDTNHENNIAHEQDDDTHFDTDYNETVTIRKPAVKKEAPKVIRKRKKMKKGKYEYKKICEICGKHTKNLLSHLDMHSSGKFYSCDVCDKKFKFKSGLIIHKAVHDPTPRKTCEVCGKTFHILAQYRRHFVYHANERKYECETCGKRFNTLDILRVHNRTHTDERPFPCPECGKTFRTAGCVSRHKRIVHRAVKNQ